MWGDCGAPLSAIIKDLTTRSAVSTVTAEQALATLTDKRQLVFLPEDKETVWLRSEARHEAQIAESTRRRLAPELRKVKAVRVPREVVVFSGTTIERTIDLTDEQLAAAKLCLSNRISLLAGPPGAGKTATLAAVVRGCAAPVIATVAAAAARRAEQVTGCNKAVTVHALTHDPRTQELRPQPGALRGCDALIIDEASMVSASQLAMLLRAADEAGVARVLLCGDPNQLQPIGSGAPFFDLIPSGGVPLATLSAIHRSQNGSGVQKLITGLRAREFDGSTSHREQFSAADVEFVFCSDDAFVENVCRKRAELVSAYGEDETTGLAPYNKDDFGIDALNVRSRQLDGCDARAPMPGEIIICVKNAPRPDDRTGYRLLNGTRLIVENVGNGYVLARPIGTDIRLRFRLEPHARGPAPDLNWGRFSTVHKFQGSEAQAALVVIPPNALKIIEGDPFLFELASFYTAISRAKRHVVIMGALEQLPELIRNGSRRRVTSLERLLRSAKL